MDIGIIGYSTKKCYSKCQVCWSNYIRSCLIPGIQPADSRHTCSLLKRSTITQMILYYNATCTNTYSIILYISKKKHKYAIIPGAWRKSLLKDDNQSSSFHSLVDLRTPNAKSTWPQHGSGSDGNWIVSLSWLFWLWDSVCYDSG